VQASRRGIELTVRLLQTRSIRQSDHPGQPVHIGRRAGSAVAAKLQRRPEQFFAIRAIESCRHHADHGIRHSVNLNGLSDDFMIGPETVAPASVAENDELAAARLVFLRRKESAEPWLRAQHGKEVRRNHASCDAFRRLSGTADIELPGDVGPHPGKQAALLFPVQKVPGREQVFVSVSLALQHKQQPAWIREGPGSQQHGANHAEHRGVGANSQRQGKHRCDRKARRLEDRSSSIANVLQQFLHGAATSCSMRRRASACIITGRRWGWIFTWDEVRFCRVGDERVDVVSHSGAVLRTAPESAH
jgi:hypothetical protein